MAAAPRSLTGPGGMGVVGAPRQPGRAVMARLIREFEAHGAGSVSPLIIPHCSLHSLAGTLSLVLQARRPNFGAGGLPGSEAEALWAACALLADARTPGVWVVWTD